jgi:hypothetical protein
MIGNGGVVQLARQTGLPPVFDRVPTKRDRRAEGARNAFASECVVEFRTNVVPLD